MSPQEYPSVTTDHDYFKIATYFSERDRHGGQPLWAAVLAFYERHDLRTAILLRGIAGFGLSRRLRTDRFETSSYDLPLVAVGIGSQRQEELVVDEFREQFGGTFFTSERTRSFVAKELGAATKLAIYCDATQRINGQSAARAIVGHLQRHDVEGATVLLGVEGIVHGRRQARHLLTDSANVPLVVKSVGNTVAIAKALPELGEMLDRPLLTLEPIRVLKRGGVQVADLGQSSQHDDGEPEFWQKLTVYSSSDDRLERRSLYTELIRRLHRQGASGATVLRGALGYHGDHEPDSERLFALRLHLPIVTVIVDRPAEVRRIWPIIDRATTETGLVTSESVQAFRSEPLQSTKYRRRQAGGGSTLTVQ